MLPKKNDILKRRAETLAKSKAPKAEKHTIEAVSFRLTDEAYGIELGFVREVLPLGPLTFIPGIPKHISGIINVRGEIISVMDLKPLFGLEASISPENQYVLIIAAPAMAFGIVADQILGVRQIPPETLQSSIPTLTGVRADYLKGVDATGLIMLDAQKMLTDESLVVNDNND